LPTLNDTGEVHEAGGQLGAVTVKTVLAPQSGVFLAVKVTFEVPPILRTVVPLNVPVDAPTVPLLLKVTLYVPSELQEMFSTVKSGFTHFVQDGGVTDIVVAVQPALLTVKLTPPVKFVKLPVLEVTVVVATALITLIL
jgi:hypothetical protein